MIALTFFVQLACSLSWCCGIGFHSQTPESTPRERHQRRFIREFGRALSSLKIFNCSISFAKQRKPMLLLKRLRSAPCSYRGFSNVPSALVPSTRKNNCFDRSSAVFRVFLLFFRVFLGCFTVTHSAPFSAVFRLFSMSGIWHVCRCPRRLQF